VERVPGQPGVLQPFAANVGDLVISGGLSVDILV
jgi:hypothetical protein